MARFSDPHADPHRPAVHFTPPRGWINDPNGLIQHHGAYHLFYQWNPHGASGPPRARMHWGHARSLDLVRWEHLPRAFGPDAPYDRGGAWSGCAATDVTHGPAMLYTGASALLMQSQCLAWPESPDLVRWRKDPRNPVIPRPPAGVPPWCFRDPFVWKHESGAWLMALGASLWGRGAVLLYESPDLTRWKYLHPLFVTHHPAAQGAMWECPNFFPLGRAWMLLVSVMDGRVLWFTGAFQNLKFKPERAGELDPGGCLYAPQTFADAAGRRLLFAWLKENRRRAVRHGWQGCLSLPRVLTIGDDDAPRIAPAAEVESLRGPGLEFDAARIDPRTPHTLHGVPGECVEIHGRLDPAAARACGLLVRRAPRGREHTAIRFDPASGRLAVDRARSSRDPLADASLRSARLRLAPGEPLDLRVFLDHSVMEIFANGRACLTSRIYPARGDSLGTALFAEGGAARLLHARAWPLG